VLCSKTALAEVAAKNPRCKSDLAAILEMKAWQRQEIGQDFLKALGEDNLK
jgi:hypothetical protein